MIPKTQHTQSFLTIERCEQIIDGRIAAPQRQPGSSVRVELTPITEDTLAQVAERYVSGGWSVSTDPQRMPNAYIITLF